MLLTRLAFLALLLACASLAHAALVEDDDDALNNEVLPEREFPVKMDVGDKVPVTVTEPEATTTAIPVTVTPTPAPSPSNPDEGDKVSTPPPPQDEAPKKQPSTLSKFLSDIIQIPIAVLRSVGGFLSHAFSRNSESESSSRV